MIKVNDAGLPDVIVRLGHDGKQNVIITAATVDSKVEFVGVEYCKELSGRSPRTAWRAIEKLKSQNGDKSMFLPFYFEMQGKYFISARLFSKKKRKNHKQGINDEYINWLRNLPWDIAGCVRYKEDISADAIRRRMTSLYNKLKNVTDGVATLFFVLELNPGSISSYHAHFVICYQRLFPVVNMKRIVKNYLSSYGDFSGVNTWCRKYDKRKNYLPYMLNELRFRDDLYDIFHEKSNSSKHIETFKR